MSKVVFYPEMGIDIIAPLQAVPKAYKIYTLGPLPKKKFKNAAGGPLKNTIWYITKLMEYGDTSFDPELNEEEDECVEFFPDIGEKLKSYNFKKKKMWLLQFRTHDQNTLSVNYHYNARSSDNRLPFVEKVDYVLHKNYDMTDNLKQLLKSIIKPSTQLIAPEDELLLEWDVPESVMEELEPIETYDINTDQDQRLFSININDYL